MGNTVFALVTAATFIPAILLGYIPFESIVSRKQKRMLCWLYAGSILLDALIYWIVDMTVGMTVGFAKVDIFVFALINTGIRILVIPGRIREHLFTYGLVAIINYTLLTVVSYVVHALFGLNGLTDHMAAGVGFCILFAVGYPWLSRLVRSTVQPFLSIDSGNYWHTLWMVPVAMYYAILLVAPGTNQQETFGHIFGCILIAVATVALCHAMAKDHQRMLEKQAVDQQLDMQKKYYMELAERVEDARRQRHDFKHHMAVVRNFIETDDKSGLEVYCDEMLRHNAGNGAIPYTGNAAVDGLVYHYSNLARERGIRFEFSGSVDSGAMADVDLCALLGNALDNALTAAAAAGNEPFIRVTADAQSGHGRVLVSNSFDGILEKDGDVFLSRKRHRVPGIGMRSMQTICDRYGVMMDARAEGETFNLLLIFP